MRRARKDTNGNPHCRNCGGTSLLARGSERGQRTKHLRCVDCGQRQRFREPKHVTS